MYIFNPVAPNPAPAPIMRAGTANGAKAVAAAAVAAPAIGAAAAEPASEAA